jgi:hypothetical protein
MKGTEAFTRIIQNYLNDEANYQKAKSKFFDINICNGEILSSPCNQSKSSLTSLRYIIIVYLAISTIVATTH